MINQDYEPYDPSSSVPTAAQKLSAKNQRAPYTGAGIYQKAREEEKKQLLDLIVSVTNENPKDIGDFIYGIPNAKFGWANVFLKKAFNTAATINPCDVQLFGSIWMSDKAKAVWETLKGNLPATKDVNAQVTAKYPTKSGIIPTCAAGVLKTNFKNPGVFNLYTNKMEQYPNLETMYDEIREYNKYGDNINYRTGRVEPMQHMSDNSFLSQNASAIAPCTISESCHCEKNAIRTLSKVEKIIPHIVNLHQKALELGRLHEKTSTLDFLDVPPHMQSLFANFRKAMIEENEVDLHLLEKVAETLKYLRGIQTSQYLLSICDPFTHRFIKAPSEIPIPSASFSVRTNINLTTNALGNVAFAFDPFFLHSFPTTAPSTFGLNNDATLTGTAANNFFMATNVGQNLPSTLYNKYRLVSAGLKFSVTSSFLNTTGFCTMGLQFDAGLSGATIPSTSINVYQQYGQFQLIENSYFKQQAPLRTGEVIQINYLPLDNTFLQFTSLGGGYKNCSFVGYATGAPASTTIGRLDLVLNFEGTVDLNWSDYIPQALSYETNSSIKYLPSVVNYLVDNNLSTSPDHMRTAIKGIMQNDDKKINIKPTLFEKNMKDALIDSKTQLINTTADQLKNILEDEKVQPEQKDKAKDFLDTLSKMSQSTMANSSFFGNDSSNSFF